MPRTVRVDIPGLLYHVTARGVERRNIFLDDSDREVFLNRFSTLLADTDTRCLAWTLMPNHIHLLLRPGPTGLAAFMRRLLTGHAVSFNRRHQRVGHLFQNRYHSILCEEDSYLLPLVRYIHLNPWQARILADLDALDRYPWCGHAVLMGSHSFVGQQVDEVLEYFGKRKKAARISYRIFMMKGFDGLQRREEKTSGKRDLVQSLGMKKSVCCDDGRILGSQAFADTILPDESENPTCRLGLQECMEKVAQEFSVTIDALRSKSRTQALSDARAIICHLAVTHLKISGAEVARQLCLARPSVTRAERRGLDMATKDVRWIKAVLQP